MINYVELAYASREHQANFRTAVKRNKGIIDMVVHPGGSHPERDVLIEADQFYSERISQGNPAVFMLEINDSDYSWMLSNFEAAKEKAFDQFTRRLSPEISGTVYTVFTQPKDPRPLQPRRIWPRVADSLHSAGVEEVILSGQKLLKAPIDECLKPGGFYELYRYGQALTGFKDVFNRKSPWLSEGFVPFGCEGVVAMWLMDEGFAVNFSRFSLPNLTIDPESYSQRGGAFLLREAHFLYPFGRKKNLPFGIRQLTDFFGAVTDHL